MIDVLIVFIVLVLMPLSIFHGIKALRESNHRMAESDREASGDTMRRSELENLIHDAVIEATEPLVARIDELEREMLLGDGGEGRLDPSALAEAFGEEEQASERSGPRRERA